MDNMKKSAGLLQAQGRHGDTILAHINPEEAKMLKAAGGSGTINPETGLPEFGFFGDLIKTAAAVAGAYFLGPAGAGILSEGVATGAMIGAGVSGLTGGNPLKGALMGGIGAFVAGGGIGSPSDWLAKTGENFGNAPGNVATKAAETTASTVAGQAGISTNAADFLSSPAMAPSYQAPLGAGAVTGATGRVIRPPQGLFDRVIGIAEDHPIGTMITGQAIAAGIGATATSQSQVEQAKLNRDAQLQVHTVQGGFSDPNAVTINDRSQWRDTAGNPYWIYDPATKSMKRNLGGTPGLLNTVRA